MTLHRTNPPQALMLRTLSALESLPEMNRDYNRVAELSIKGLACLYRYRSLANTLHRSARVRAWHHPPLLYLKAHTQRWLLSPKYHRQQSDQKTAPYLQVTPILLTNS